MISHECVWVDIITRILSTAFFDTQKGCSCRAIEALFYSAASRNIRQLWLWSPPCKDKFARLCHAAQKTRGGSTTKKKRARTLAEIQKPVSHLHCYSTTALRMGGLASRRGIWCKEVGSIRGTPAIWASIQPSAPFPGSPPAIRVAGIRISNTKVRARTKRLNLVRSSHTRSCICALLCPY